MWIKVSQRKSECFLHRFFLVFIIEAALECRLRSIHYLGASCHKFVAYRDHDFYRVTVNLDLIATLGGNLERKMLVHQFCQLP